jgi:4-diphosphocytidyl-2C-methyl-D-erythritol 2-phosphate synthase
MMQREQLLLRAPAKVNLYLKVIGRRADGYHLLDTLMQKVGLYDEIEVQACAEGIHLHCVNGTLPENRDNIVYRAAELFCGKPKGDEKGMPMGCACR